MKVKAKKLAKTGPTFFKIQKIKKIKAHFGLENTLAQRILWLSPYFGTETLRPKTTLAQ